MNKTYSPIDVEDIKSYFKTRVSNCVQLFEFGIHSSRFDMIRIDTWKHIIKGFEFKITKADFKSDKKWEKYLNYCHSLTFVCPTDLITTKELPPHIGILHIKKWHWDREPETRWNEPYWFYDGTWIRKPRNTQIDKDTYIEVISLLLNRTKWRWKEFF